MGNTAQQVQDWINGPVGQTLGNLGQQVASGNMPSAQAITTAATALAGQNNQSVNDFLQSQGGHLLQQYIGQVAGGTPPGQALGSMAGAVVTAGAAAGLSALGIPPPASGMLASVAGSLVDQIAHSLFGGEGNSKDFPNLSGDFRWRAEKYFTKCLPQAFVDYMKQNGLSIEKAVIEPPSGQAPPWNGLSTALALWLMKGAWGTPKIMLPGTTTYGDACTQFFIGYSLPWNAGDGWIRQHLDGGWWWYPSMSQAEVEQVKQGKRPANPGPIWEMYERIGIDVLATWANVWSKKDASWSNVIYRPQGYTVAADAIEQAANTPKPDRTKGQQAIINTINGKQLDRAGAAKLGTAKGGTFAGAGGAAVIAAALLLMARK